MIDDNDRDDNKREAKLRRLARKNDLTLRKSHASGYYSLVDTRRNALLCYATEVDLDVIERFLGVRPTEAR